MLDVIAVRCEYLNAVVQQTVVRKSAELCDQVFTISDFSRFDFISYYGFGEKIKVIHLATNANGLEGEQNNGDYVLIVGNHYFHKCVDEAIHLLEGQWPLVVLGGRSASTPPRAKHFASGLLTRSQMRQLFWKARVIVYPSLYEGFGLPVLDGLAMGKPVVLLDTSVARELEALAGHRRIYWAKSLRDLPSAVERAIAATPVHYEEPVRRWRATGEGYAAAFKTLLAQDIDLNRLRARWDCLRTVRSYGTKA